MRLKNDTQFWFCATMLAMKALGVRPSAPWLNVAPVADVKSSDAAAVPVA